MYIVKGSRQKPESQSGDWAYFWNANGMLQKVKRPDGKEVSFEYDALGRRIAKIGNKKITRYIWDGNVLLHEWSYDVEEKPKSFVDDEGNVVLEKESVDNVVTWVYGGNRFAPVAKLFNGKKYSVISDYLGTPIQSFDEKGNLVWERELDIYGNIKKEIGDINFVPFKYQGQYYDDEANLLYNRFRYYSPETGCYISKDPIGLMGDNPNFYAYVIDTNGFTDPSGLSSVPSFDDLQKMAHNSLDFSTVNNGAVFWSGQNMKTAQNWAHANGKTTLEQTVGGKYLNDLDLFNPKNGLTGSQAAEIWDIASKRFADGASGDVNVFSTGAKRFGPYGERTWWRIEKRALLKNKNVKNILRRKQDGNKSKNGHIKCS